MYNFHEYKKEDGPHKFFTLSFDDGVTQDIRFIQILNKYNLKCTFNLNSGLFGTKHILEGNDFKVDHSEIAAELVRSTYEGHEVAVHSLHHPRLDLLSHDELLHEVDDDRKNLEELTGQKVIGMAYPGGPYYNQEGIDIILNETPIRYARNVNSHNTFVMPDYLMEWRPTCHWREEKIYELADEFINAKAEEDMLFYVWGHSYEFDIHNEWDEIEKFCAKMAGHDDICYATNGEIAQYIMNNTEAI